jgi:hypothetical protein
MKTESDVKALSRKVADNFRNEKFEEAFIALKTYWPLDENELTEMKNKTVTYLAGIKIRFGEPIAAAKVNEEKILDFALRETYIIRYNLSAIRLKLSYFRNENGWIINSFKWDDSYSEEFK